MAHELSIRKNGMAEMAYVGEKPWHGLGQELQPNATIEQWQKAAGMDWKVKRSKVRYATSARDDAKLLIDEDKHVLFRSDTHAPLSIVSSKFQVVQPAEVLEFFRDLVDVGGYKLCTAGVLKGGQKLWAQAEASIQATVMGNDIIESKLLIATACDGTMRTIVKRVCERVVCANTLAVAMSEKGAAFQLSHRSEFKPEEVKAYFGLTVHQFDEFVKDARVLAKTKVTADQVDTLLADVLHNVKIPKRAVPAELQPKLDAVRSSASYKKVLELFKGDGRGSQTLGNINTAWGLVNAVTEYVDHHRGRANDSRIDYAWFGPGDAIKTKAFNEALELAKA